MVRDPSSRMIGSDGFPRALVMAGASVQRPALIARSSAHASPPQAGSPAFSSALRIRSWLSSSLFRSLAFSAHRGRNTSLLRQTKSPLLGQAVALMSRRDPGTGSRWSPVGA